MNSCVNSVLLLVKLWHEFTVPNEIMVEFINLKLIRIQLQIGFSEGKYFIYPK